jgi:hypothetical protein
MGRGKKPRTTAYRHKLIDNLGINQQKPIDLIINNQTNNSEVISVCLSLNLTFF